MAEINLSDYVLESKTELGELADVIREKSGAEGSKTVPEMAALASELMDKASSDALLSRSGVTYFEVPNDITTLGANAFAGMTDLEIVGIPSSVVKGGIADSAFSGCTNLKKIYCVFLEGEVSGAPWGAPTTAEIIYDAVLEGTKGLTYEEGPLVIGTSPNEKYYEGYVVTGTTGNDAELVIPSVYKGQPVAGVKAWAFSENKDIKSLVIGNGVIGLGESAFSNCSNLVSIRDHISARGARTYRATGITEYVYPKEATWSGYGTFVECSNLKSVVFHDKFAGLNGQIFFKCTSLEEIVFPESCTGFGEGSILSGCTNLKRVEIKTKKPRNNISGENGLVTTLFAGIPQGVEIFFAFAEGEIVDASPWSAPNGTEFIYSYGEGGTQGLEFTFDEVTQTYSVTGYSGTATDIYISSTYMGLPVTSIGDEVFKQKSITSVRIPDSVTSIGNEAFYFCSDLEDVIFGNGIQTIGDSAFMGCDKLKPVELPESLTSIGAQAFEGWSIETLTIPENVTEIGDSAFAFCWDLKSVLLNGFNPMNISNDIFVDCEALQCIFCKYGSFVDYGNSDDSGSTLGAPNAVRLYDYVPSGSGNIEYSEVEDSNGNYYLASSFLGSGIYVYIPSTYNGLPVKGVGVGLFAGKGESVKAIISFANLTIFGDNWNEDNIPFYNNMTEV